MTSHYRYALQCNSHFTACKTHKSGLKPHMFDEAASQPHLVAHIIKVAAAPLRQ